YFEFIPIELIEIVIIKINTPSVIINFNAFINKYTADSNKNINYLNIINHRFLYFNKLTKNYSMLNKYKKYIKDIYKNLIEYNKDSNLNRLIKMIINKLLKINIYEINNINEILPSYIINGLKDYKVNDKKVVNIDSIFYTCYDADYYMIILGIFFIFDDTISSK